tara:strand:- start:293 stop:1045 length:753 start_codon:yes stop_codon:yes gene_type:complete
MKFFNYKEVKMMFVPLMGAFVQGVKSRYSQRESFLVVMGGPIPGIILGVIGSVFAVLYQIPWFFQLCGIFMLLNMINLLPLDPLDGGQLFRLLVKYDHDLFLMIFSLVSSIILIAIGLLVNEWPLILFGFLMSFRVRSIQKKHLIRKEFRINKLNYRLAYDDLSNRDYSLMKAIVLDHNPALKKYNELSQDSNDFLLAENVNSVLETPLSMDTNIWFKVGVISVWLLSFSLPIILFVCFQEDIQWYFNYI